MPPPELMDLVTHNDVMIQAPTVNIWPYIVDPTAWKSAVILAPVGAAATGTGRRFKAIEPDDPHNVLFHAEDVEYIVEKRRTIRLNDTDGTLIGFATWRLTPQNGGTRVEYDVYCRLAVPASPSGRSAPDSPLTSADFQHATGWRFAQELIALKALVEGVQ